MSATNTSASTASVTVEIKRHPRLHSNWLRVRFGPDGKRITELHDQLAGALAITESAFLYHAAKTAESIIEIGSFRGKSAVIMALASRTPERPGGARITCIDPHAYDYAPEYYEADTYGYFHATLKKFSVDSQVCHIREYSQKAKSKYEGGQVDLLFVDGDHTYEGAKRDFIDWASHVKPGGVVAAHDTFRDRFPGALPAWNDTVGADPDFGPTQRVRSIAWARRLR